jgi:hypothetical protein
MIFFSFCFLAACSAIAPVTPEPAEEWPDAFGTPSQETPSDKGQPELTQTPPVVLAAAKDLSQHLGVGVDDISVVEIEAVTWPDASLGCPEPGIAYIQVLSPGFRIVLEADGSEYIYHTDQGENVVLCPEGGLKDPSQTAPVIESGLESLIAQAAELLADELDIEASEIKLLEARSIVWSDASLGCPEPDASYIQVPKEGALIRLSAQGEEYSFHIGEGSGLFLCENPSQP